MKIQNLKYHIWTSNVGIGMSWFTLNKNRIKNMTFGFNILRDVCNPLEMSNVYSLC